MKKKFEILMVACLFISAFLLARASAALTSSRHAASSKTCIVLDAGHGGTEYICYKKDSNFSFKSIKIPLSYFSHLNFS